MALELPRDLEKDGRRRTATTPSEYWNLFYSGYVPVDGPAVAEVSYDELTPAQKAARTRAEKKAQEDGDSESGSQKPDEDPTAQAGNANES
jgi:hypothetical protein